MGCASSVPQQSEPESQKIEHLDESKHIPQKAASRLGIMEERPSSVHRKSKSWYDYIQNEMILTI